jgi:hypothetical protein
MFLALVSGRARYPILCTHLIKDKTVTMPSISQASALHLISIGIAVTLA